MIPTADQQHIGSHRNLLGSALFRGPAAGRRLDAVIVPSVRAAHSLRHAAQVAAMLRAHLVVLSSRNDEPPECFAALARITGRQALTVLRLPDGYRHPLLKFSTSDVPAASRWRDVDTGVKRNLGLLTARMMGWQSLLFLDDDVCRLPRPALRRMVDAVARQYSPWRVAGCAFPEFSKDGSALTGDNSVVCHANRMTGGVQDTFIGGGAMAIRIAGGRWPFFPDVYNEDWLFLFGLMLWQRPKTGVALAGELQQLPQDPFGSPETAAAQEFGDVLAEGLARVLHLKLSRQGAASAGYWRDVLSMRGRFIDEIITRALTQRHTRADEITKSLTRAHEVLADIEPEHLADYVRAWRSDLSGWHRRQGTLPAASTMSEALATLELTDHVLPTAPRRRPVTSPLLRTARLPRQPDSWQRSGTASGTGTGSGSLKGRCGRRVASTDPATINANPTTVAAVSGSSSSSTPATTATAGLT